MMILFFFLLFLFIVFLSSFHSFMLLLTVELLVLSGFFLILMNFYSWCFSIIFLLFSVCMSSYGISLVVDCFRSKGSFYLMGVNLS